MKVDRTSVCEQKLKQFPTALLEQLQVMRGIRKEDRKEQNHLLCNSTIVLGALTVFENQQKHPEQTPESQCFQRLMQGYGADRKAYVLLKHCLPTQQSSGRNRTILVLLWIESYEMGASLVVMFKLIIFAGGRSQLSAFILFRYHKYNIALKAIQLLGLEEFNKSIYILNYWT